MNTQSSVNSQHFQSGCVSNLKYQPLTDRALYEQNRAFQGTGGVSEGNRSQGFIPAFLDTETNKIYLACYTDGRLAPIHLLDGLPQELVLSRNTSGKCTAIKSSVVAGFVRDSLFYTREQAARSL